MPLAEEIYGRCSNAALFFIELAPFCYNCVPAKEAQRMIEAAIAVAAPTINPRAVLIAVLCAIGLMTFVAVLARPQRYASRSQLGCRQSAHVTGLPGN